ncbi:MAG: peptidoglycan editing factor PgeF [Rubrivivax sp.]|nr:peptidoglycan editing factor PgeF [Rubrivivax sp.]
MSLPGLRPDWPAPPAVAAFMSTRLGGVSAAPWDSLNVGMAVGDDALAVAENRRRLAEQLGVPPVWLRQVHGTRVVRVGAADLDCPAPMADAAWTDEVGVACTVQVADCLPLLLARADGLAVAAVHAGWRSLAGGIVAATLDALCAGSGGGSRRAEVLAWLGPCIGPRQFEVGADVLAAFGADPAQPDAQRFNPRPRADGSARWLANLAQLTRDSLQAAGVECITGAGECTVEDASRFFSYRRDGVSGRMVVAVWRRP